jgi:hypothetical protein
MPPLLGKSMYILTEVVVARQQRMKVVTREQWLFVLSEGMKGFFIGETEDKVNRVPYQMPINHIE